MTVAIVQIACCLFNILNTSKTRQLFSYSGAFSRFVWPICEKYLICIHFVHIKLITGFSIAGILHLNGSREREGEREKRSQREIRSLLSRSSSSNRPKQSQNMPNNEQTTTNRHMELERERERGLHCLQAISHD